MGERFQLLRQSAASTLWKSRLKCWNPANFADENQNDGKNPEKTGETMIDRESAWCLLTEFTQSESLRKHALAVEACMRACARKFGNGSPEDENLWGVVGLIHDFDYERWATPEEHLYNGNE